MTDIVAAHARGAAQALRPIAPIYADWIEQCADAHEENHRLRAEIERLREALEKLSCKCTSICDWDFDGEVCPSWVARAALKGDE